MIAGTAARLAAGGHMGRGEARAAAAELLSGRASDGDGAAFLAALAEKGETDEELLGMLDALDAGAIRADLPGARRRSPVDVCGTGGDGGRTFNVSTAAAFICAAAGAPVAKHGNRSSRRGSWGSADVFERLGCRPDAPPGEAASDFERLGICFMFAPAFHPSMRHVARARMLAGRRTAFNLLGPLCNPAGVRRQLVGVTPGGMLERVPRLLAARGAERAAAVTSSGGADELTTDSRGLACTVSAGEDPVTEAVDPWALGLARSLPGDLAASSPGEAFAAFAGAVDGTAPRAVRETAALNAGMALAVAGLADGLADGLAAATEAVEGGAAAGLLRRFAREHGAGEALERGRPA